MKHSELDFNNIQPQKTLISLITLATVPSMRRAATTTHKGGNGKIVN